MNSRLFRLDHLVAAIRGTKDYGMSAGWPFSLRLDAYRFHDRSPLLGFGGDKFSKFGGCHRYWHVAQLRKLCLQAGIGKTGIDLLVQPLNDFDGDALGRANPQP